MNHNGTIRITGTALALGLALACGPAAGDDAFTSTRDCLGSVNKVATRLGLSTAPKQPSVEQSEAKNLLDQARDLCTQSRFEQAAELLAEAQEL